MSMMYLHTPGKLMAIQLEGVRHGSRAGAERRMNGKAYTFLEVDLAELVHQLISKGRRPPSCKK